MAAMIVALIMVCTGSECRVLDGYPMGFASDAECRDHLAEMADQVVNTGDAETEVVMLCSADVFSYDGTLPDAK